MTAVQRSLLGGLPAVLERYTINETRFSGGRLRVEIVRPDDWSYDSRVFIVRPGYDRRALLWRAHNSFYPPAKRPRIRHDPPRQPQREYWRAELDALAKRAGWKPDWEGRGYNVTVGMSRDQWGHPVSAVAHVAAGGFGYVGYVRPCESRTFPRSHLLLSWLRAEVRGAERTVHSNDAPSSDRCRPFP